MTTTDYQAFLERKTALAPASGIDVAPDAIHASLFPFQRDLVRWSLRKGRAAIWADTGLGKTRMQIEWARLTGVPTLILAPLAVARQTVAEAASIGVEVVYARSQADAGPITITNYEMLSHFEPAAFGAVVLDESSILKSMDGKVRTALIAAFRETPYRLCCTATPAPNDIAELANHAEFLGILSRTEMLASFFVHDQSSTRGDGDGWRLKGHAHEPFYRWLASWGMSVKRPSDLGYADDGYDLPALAIESVILPTEYIPDGQLFATSIKGITDRAKVRKDTIGARVAAAVDLVGMLPDEPWILWCGLNDEQDALSDALGERAISVYGSLSADDKANRIFAWLEGEAPVLISKVSIAGFGMNFQRCARMVFVGLGDSYEQYYQAIRRCWRFGQTRAVVAYVVLTEPEEAIYQNVLRKEREAQAMGDELVRHVASYERAEIGQARRQVAYEPQRAMRLPAWLGGGA